ncbi:MAG: hypothetical protein JSR45_09100 [Proteobacteria bacterium]|nr:hypothetical protein [Pseudomonadota bacterium]
MSSLSIAAIGMAQAAQRLDQANIAVSNAARPGSDADMGEAKVEEIQAELAFQAAVSVVRVADESVGRVIDMKT